MFISWACIKHAVTIDATQCNLPALVCLAIAVSFFKRGQVAMLRRALPREETCNGEVGKRGKGAIHQGNLAQ